jgi:hypothetical protein
MTVKVHEIDLSELKLPANTLNANSIISTPGKNYTLSTTTSIHTNPIPTSMPNGLTVKGDLVVNGVSLVNVMDTVMSRLAILQPNPEKLEKYEALKRAYDDYKLLESILNE